MMIDEREPNLSNSSLGSENAVASRSKSSPKFFLLVFVLSIPFGLAGALTRLELLPGLPLSSLMWVCPAIAASILVYRENKIEGVIELLKRAFDYPRIKEKDWIRANNSPNAWRDSLGVCSNASEGVAASSSAIFGSGCSDDVRYVFCLRFG